MDVYSAVIRQATKLKTVNEWMEMGAILESVADSRPGAWVLPTRACKAVGGRTENALPGATAIACAQVSIILIDDMLDDDPRGEHRRVGAASAANLAAGFQAASIEALGTSKATAEMILPAQKSLNRMLLKTAFGQHLDVQNPDDEEGYWALVRTKSAPFFGAALHLGALLGGTAPELAEQVRQFGELYGEMVQIHDDLRDTMATPASPDWTQGRYTLPILFAHVVDHPDRAHFLEMRNDIQDPDILEQAQTILIRCGAISYCIHELVERYELAKKKVRRMGLEKAEEFEDLLEGLVTPVRELLVSIGADLPEGLSAGNPAREQRGG